MQDAMSDLISGKIAKPTWAQHLQASEDQLLDRLNLGRFAHAQQAWSAEKESGAGRKVEPSHALLQRRHDGFSGDFGFCSLGFGVAMLRRR